jgi:hypothetical protein
MSVYSSLSSSTGAAVYHAAVMLIVPIVFPSVLLVYLVIDLCSQDHISSIHYLSTWAVYQQHLLL